MSEQFIIENTSFEQDLNAEISEDSFEARYRLVKGKRRGSIKNSRRGKSKALANARKRIKKAQVARRKIARKLR